MLEHWPFSRHLLEVWGDSGDKGEGAGWQGLRCQGISGVPSESLTALAPLPPHLHSWECEGFLHGGGGGVPLLK